MAGFDYTAGMNDLQRRKVLLQALQGQAMSDPYSSVPTVRGIPVAVGAGPAIGKMLQSALAAYGMKKQTAAENTFQTDNRKAIAEAIGQYGSSPDKFAQAQRMAISDNPTLANFGTQQAALGKDFLSTKGATMGSRVDAMQELDPTKLQGEKKYIQSNGYIFEDGPNGLTPLKDTNKTAGEIEQLMVGDKTVAVQRDSQGFYKTIAGDAPSTTVNNTNLHENSLSKVLSTKIGESMPKAKAAVSSIGSLGTAHDAISKGAITGAAADFRLKFGQYKTLLTSSKSDPSVVNSQTFQAAMANPVFAAMKNLGNAQSLTDTDREFALKASGGDINLDEGTIKRVLDISAANNLNTIEEHNQLLEDARKDPFYTPGQVESFQVRQPPPPKWAHIRKNEETGLWESIPPPEAKGPTTPTAPTTPTGAATDTKPILIEDGWSVHPR